jgi:hypothetical protein
MNPWFPLLYIACTWLETPQVFHPSFVVCVEAGPEVAGVVSHETVPSFHVDPRR